MLKRTIVIFAASFFATSANSQCACNRVVPYSGQYKVGFPEKANRPAQATIQISATETGSGSALAKDFGGQVVMIAPDGSADLTCTGDRYVGNMENGRTESQPMRLFAQAVPGVGIKLGTVFVADVRRPKRATVDPNEPFIPTMYFKLVGKGTATPAMCEIVRTSIDFYKDQIVIHNDPGLLATAERDRVGSYHETRDYCKNKDKTGCKSPLASTTYQKLVAAKTNSNNSTAGAAKSYFGASTDPLECTITPPSMQRQNETCYLAIEIEAILAHESVHRGTCRSMKPFSDQPSDYQYWINYPPNLAADETKAYDKGISVLQSWLGSNC